jgi:hypothetical protein
MLHASPIHHSVKAEVVVVVVVKMARGSMTDPNEYPDYSCAIVSTHWFMRLRGSAKPCDGH